jgi:predicted acyltransferase
LVALFYFIIDVKGIRKWSFWLKVIGMNSIAIYMAGHFINFEAIVNKLIFGLEQFTHAYYPFILSVGGMVLIYIIMYWMYKKGTFIKV